MFTEAPELTEAQSQAFGQLMEAHYVPAFVKSCADRGIEVNDGNIQQILETTAKVKEQMAQDSKQASEGGQKQVVDAAAHSLNVALYGEEKAAEMLGGVAPAVAIPDASMQSINALLAKPAEAKEAAAAPEAK